MDFEEAVKSIEKKLYLTALTILKNPEDAKDALQEAIFIAYKKYDDLKSSEAFPYWITAILVNEANRLYKRRKRFVDISDYKSIFSCDADKSDLDFFEMISNLCKQDKTVIILRFYYDYSIEQISQIINKPISTTKSRLYRAVNKLKNNGGMNCVQSYC